MTSFSRSPTVLSWDEQESIDCKAQGILTNDTDNVWLSCKTYIGRGTLLYDEVGDFPSRIQMKHWNWDALKGPREI